MFLVASLTYTPLVSESRLVSRDSLTWPLYVSEATAITTHVCRITYVEKLRGLTYGTYCTYVLTGADSSTHEIDLKRTPPCCTVQYIKFGMPFRHMCYVQQHGGQQTQQHIGYRQRKMQSSFIEGRRTHQVCYQRWK